MLLWFAAHLFPCSSLADDLLWLDVDDSAKQTDLGHVSLNPDDGAVITNDGIVISLAGSPGYERGFSNERLIMDAVTASGSGAALTVVLENMPAGTWTVESWHWQGSGVSGEVQIEFGLQGGSTLVVANQQAFSVLPASYQITTNGSSTYELRVVEDDANNRVCLNGLRIRPVGDNSFPPVTLVDVNASNTISVGGSPSPFFVSNANTGSQWRRRPNFGFDVLDNTEVFEKDANGGTGDATILETTVSGLTPGVTYGLYSAFLSVPNESWRIRMGLSPSDLTEFTPTSPTDRILDLGLSGVSGSNRNQYLGYLTNITADSNGELTVYFDDGEGSGSSERTWLEGLAIGEPYEVPSDLPPPPLPGGALEVAPDGVWTWFNDERAIFHQGYLYSGYVRKDGHVGLTRFDPVTSTSEHMQLSTSRSRQVDDHNNPSITVLPDNTLLVTYAKHNASSEYYYRTSTNITPSQDSHWTNEKIRSTTSRSTYANTYRLSAESDLIYNFSRSISFNPTLTFSSDNGQSYGTPQHFIRTGSGSVRPYPRYVSNDVDRIDLIYTDGHPRNENNSIYHLYYHQNNFRKTDGTVVKSVNNLPLDHDNGERGTVIYSYSSDPWSGGQGPDDYIPDARAWTWDIHYGDDGHPVCVFQAQVNNVMGNEWQDDRIYYYYARWTGTTWEKRFIAQAGRGIYDRERDYGGGMSLDPEDPRIVYISSNAASPFDLSNVNNVPLNASQRYEIYRGFTDDGGETFTWEPITQNSAADNLRPIVPKNHDRTEALVWFTGRYTTYTNYDAMVVTRLGENTTDFAAFAQAESLSGDPAADQDGDGFSDLLEFALQSDPKNPGSLPQAGADGLGVVVPALAARTGTDLLVESSLNLVNWEPAAVIRANHLPTDLYPGFSMEGDGMMKVTGDNTDEPQRFYRLSVKP